MDSPDIQYLHTDIETLSPVPAFHHSEIHQHLLDLHFYCISSLWSLPRSSSAFFCHTLLNSVIRFCNFPLSATRAASSLTTTHNSSNLSYRLSHHSIIYEVCPKRNRDFKITLQRAGAARLAMVLCSGVFKV